MGLTFGRESRTIYGNRRKIVPGMNAGCGVALAVVRSIRSPRELVTAQAAEDFEQELLDQYALAMSASGVGDEQVASHRATLFEFIRFLQRPVWTAEASDADRYLAWLRSSKDQANSTRYAKAIALRQFYGFLVMRYQGDIHALTGHVVDQPIDEFNRPTKPYHDVPRVPPSQPEVEELFSRWREWLPEARKFLPAARDYLAASLWRRAGLRISESVMLDIRDWRPDLGELGKLHVRYGKGSRGRGPKTRLVPGINAVDELLTWWLLHIDDRVIPLAEPVYKALAAWLDYRRNRWPRTNNAYLFVTTRTASSDGPASRRWIWDATGPGLSATSIRQDRILDEAQATKGDVRRLADLFGLSIAAGNRYAATVEHPDLTALT
jgi:site-specific recombinase XerD